MMTVRGVFSSWEASATNCRCWSQAFSTRADHPPCQQHRNAQEYSQTQHPQGGTALGKAQKRRFFAGHIRKDDGLGQRGADLQKAKIVLRNDPRIPGFGRGRLHKGGEEHLIGQVIVAPHHGGQLPRCTDLQQEIGQMHPRFHRNWGRPSWKGFAATVRIMERLSSSRFWPWSGTEGQKSSRA